ncbi:fimbrial protein [Pantoea allii]|uniref:fimbrial protein n=1 Tax=Pantoea TaxID=53335 RepID=UPI0007C84AA9|nr:MULTISPECIES: fimbrial protein [Pantoea]MBW1251457.1 type 1 fimbrial protein [Pantoea allii]MBW1261242.1 type 1 fimbrial protein [Pantoea allii]MBW1282651.1 type 1 fimbrial protein [Pantoea allii]MCH9297539.1 type 1 fimbrial protein [Pantoea allii]OAE07234.1 fimbrial protein [Pantoea sp. OXWO6B1]
MKARSLSRCMYFALCGVSLLSFNTFAASQNTIRFQGEVNAQTCNVNINDATGSPIILLPTVSTASLNAAKSTAGKTPFTINLTGCVAPAAGTTQAININLAGNNISSTGDLLNTGTATNVALRLLDSSDKTINLSGGTATVNGMSLASGSTSASQNFSVEYYSDSGSAGAGTVLSSVQYSVSYP